MRKGLILLLNKWLSFFLLFFVLFLYDFLSKKRENVHLDIQGLDLNFDMYMRALKDRLDFILNQTYISPHRPLTSSLKRIVRKVTVKERTSRAYLSTNHIQSTAAYLDIDLRPCNSPFFTYSNPCDFKKQIPLRTAREIRRLTRWSWITDIKGSGH